MGEMVVYRSSTDARIKTFREPLVAAEGGDYRWQERFKKRPSDYKLKFVNDSQKDEFFDLVKVITEDFPFFFRPGIRSRSSRHNN